MDAAPHWPPLNCLPSAPKAAKRCILYCQNFFISSSFLFFVLNFILTYFTWYCNRYSRRTPTSAQEHRTGAEAFPGKFDYTAAKKKSARYKTGALFHDQIIKEKRNIKKKSTSKRGAPKCLYLAVDLNCIKRFQIWLKFGVFATFNSSAASILTLYILKEE